MMGATLLHYGIVEKMSGGMGVAQRTMDRELMAACCSFVPPGTCIRLSAPRPEPGNRAIEGGEHDRTWRTNEPHDIPVPRLFAGGSLSHAPRRHPSGSGIPEVHRPPRSGDELSLGRVGPPPRIGACLRHAGRHGQSPRSLSGFPRALERRRPRCSHAEASQGGVRKVEIIPALRSLLARPPARTDSGCKVAPGIWRPRFFRVPPMRFCSEHEQLRNRPACMATRENRPAGHLCQIVPGKRPSRTRNGCILHA